MLSLKNGRNTVEKLLFYPSIWTYHPIQGDEALMPPC